MAEAATQSQTVPSTPPSPAASCRASLHHKVSDEEAFMSVQQFLDEWHACIIHSGLGKTWGRTRVLHAMLTIIEMNGTPISEVEREKLVRMEEKPMLYELVNMIPFELRNQLEILALGLDKVMEVVSDVRRATEALNDEGVQQAFVVAEEDDQKRSIAQELLKNGIVQGAQEVARVKRCRDTWMKSTKGRVERLERAKDCAEQASAQLVAVEAQIANESGNAKSKGKEMLSGVAAKNDKMLMHTLFAAWLGDHMKCKAQGELRQKFIKQLQDAENALISYQEKRILLVRNTLMRKAGESDQVLVALCFETWWEDIDEHKRDGDGKSKMAAMQAKIDAQAATQKENTKKVMARMSADSDGALVGGCFNGWLSFHQDYAKNRELEEQVRATEKALKEHMEKKKDEAKGVLDRMSAATGTGLVSSCVTAWANYIKDEKADRAMQEKLMENNDRFKSLSMRQSGNAKGVQTRVNDQMRQNLCLKVVGCWALGTKAAKVEKYYINKIDSKRRQLTSVQQLFKSFSKQLEAGLANVDGDSSARSTSNVATKSRREHGKHGGSSKSSGRSGAGAPSSKLSSGRDTRSLPHIRRDE